MRLEIRVSIYLKDIMIQTNYIRLVLAITVVSVFMLITASYAFGATTLTGAVDNTGLTSVVSALSKGSGSFVIDHPLDPENKLLYHSFVESPDVKNIYDGLATLNSNGEVKIKLPKYFFALNGDFRYLATPVAESMPGLYLKKEADYVGIFGLFKIPTFTIAGGKPNGRISWQVTGIRHDPYILTNPIIPEVDKGPDEIVDVGECIFEPLCI